jgi:hypothetical protein
MEPYGCCPLPSDYRHFFGVILGFPALVILASGLKFLAKLLGYNFSEKS